MAASSKAVWGFDLGQCALKALRVRAAGDKVEVLDYAYIEHEKILSQPQANRDELIAATMRKFVENHDLTRDVVVVGVPGQSTLARFIKLPPVEKKAKIPDLVKYEASQQIPFDMDEVIWDYQTFETSGTAELEVGIFAMRRSLMRDHLRFLTDFNIEPAVVQSNPLALYSALRFDGICGKEPLAILDIGTENTDLLVVDGDSLWTRNIPLGGNEFTNTLVKSFKMQFHKAEELKRKAPTHQYARQIFQAMRPALADLAAEVQRSIGYFTSARRGVKITRLIAMGNAFRLLGLTKFMQQTLDMEVVRPTTFSRLLASTAPNAPQLMDQLISFGVAYGLALQGLGLSAITTNLLPPEIAKQIVWRRKTPWFYGAAACLLASAGTVWLVNFSDQRALASATGEGAAPPPRPADVQQAAAILSRPIDPSLPPRFAAQLILDAVQLFDEEQNRIKSENEQVLAKAREIEELQLYKTRWPRILDMIHGALPTKDVELLAAMLRGPQAYRELIAGAPEKYERTRRQEVFIQELTSTYSADVFAAWEAATRGDAGPGLLPPGMPAPDIGSGVQEPARPGFLIRLIGRTPFAGGDQIRGVAFVNGTFIANLRKSGFGPKEVYLDKFRLVRCQAYREARGLTYSTGVSPAGPTYSRPPTGGGRGPGPAPGIGPGVATITDPMADKDPVTGEPMGNDWVFEVVFVAVLGDRPEAPPAEGGNAPADGGSVIPPP